MSELHCKPHPSTEHGKKLMNPITRLGRRAWRVAAATTAATILAASGVLVAHHLQDSHADHYRTSADDMVVPHSDGGLGSGFTGPTGYRDLATLLATPNSNEDPFTITDVSYDGEGNSSEYCSVGSVVVECQGPLLNPAPEQYVSTIVKYATQANVDPRLMLDILIAEEAHPHYLGGDAFNGWWDANIDPNPDGPSYGMADMKQDAFNQVQAEHPNLFGNYQWTDLQNNDDLAIQTLAWKLHDTLGLSPIPGLNVDPKSITDPATLAKPNIDMIAPTWSGNLYRDEMLGVSWNNGAGVANSFAGIGQPLSADQLTKPTNEKNLIDQNWDYSNQVICDSGAFTCS
jgi:hypothetical protein